MCGFTGFWAPNNTLDEAGLLSRVQEMGERIAHRGPDDADEWADESSGIALAFRRLSILDLSAAGRQPMASHSQRYVVTFNGEIYNFRDLRRDLKAQGARFDGHSDTEVMVELIDRHGFVDALPLLRGMFAIACYDRKEKILHLARDPRGKKPLYFGEMKGTFLFASQPKAFLAHPAFEPEINRDELTAFFRFGYIPAPGSIFRDIFKLRAGERAEVRDGRVVTKCLYYDFARQAASASPQNLSDEAAIDHLEGLVATAVEQRLAADVPLGAFLSGGIDSSLIVAMMKQRASGGVRSFAIGFEEDAYDESGHAEAVAAHLRVNHETMRVSPQEVMDTIPALPSIYDEPFADPSQVPTFLLCQLTQKHVTVALSGDGGDELFAGYSRYGLIDNIARSLDRIPASLKPALRHTLRTVPTRAWSLAEPLIPKRFGNTPLASRVQRVADMLDSDAVEKLYRELVGQWRDPRSLVIDGVDDLDPIWLGRDDFEGCSASRKAQLIDVLSYLPENILVKVDRASMAVGLEVRAPLLDQEITDFAFALPQEQLVRDGKAKWLLRQVLYRHVPAELIDRPKMGFGFPVAEWLRGPLKEWANDLLDPDTMRHVGILNSEEVSRKWHDHLSGKADWSYRLWCVLMFEAWRRSFLS